MRRTSPLGQRLSTTVLLEGVFMLSTPGMAHLAVFAPISQILY